jgi:site-specific DNA recombinase
MNSIRAAFYARVSSEQQATAHTIESQLAALSERAQADGSPVPLERQFVDDGYSGATLVRPAMDRLRDLAAVGGVDSHLCPLTRPTGAQLRLSGSAHR